ncbi:Sterol uptake control protein 2 [Lachnellula arida]|uniref:Sterol uptake control protein 2 n=1 Tax=Lachnellula arida TaxID=1316785 RepID=A0A8T9BAM4_9HELO|nr:Sterol uptake control protein 2 [Lachnellula arida]
MLSGPPPAPSIPDTPSSAPAFSRATPSPSPSILQHSLPHGNFTMLDLELLHSWVIDGAAAFMDYREADVHVFTTTVIQIAFQHPFLMHQILSLGALYLAHVNPQKASLYQHASDNHSAIGITLFQPQIGNMDENNCHACFAFSTHLFLLAWANQDVSKPSTIFFAPTQKTDSETVNIQWVKLHRGAMQLIIQFWSVLEHGPMHVLFDDWIGLHPHREDPVEDSVRPHLDSLAEAWISGSTTMSEKEILFKTLGLLRRIFSMMSFVPQIGNLHIVMAWFSWIPDRFIVMLENKVPEALLIVSYYCVALQKMGHIFWLTGKAENLLKTVVDVLGDGWERWTRWPIEQVLGVDGLKELSVADNQS